MPLRTRMDPDQQCPVCGASQLVVERSTWADRAQWAELGRSCLRRCGADDPVEESRPAVRVG